MASRASKPLPPDDIKRRIEKALAFDGTHTFDDLCEKLMSGQAQMHWSDNGAWITRIEDSPQKRTLFVWIVAGQMPGVMTLQGKVDQFARDNNCAEMVAVCRKGWLKHLKTYNWKFDAVVLRRAVEAA